MVRVRIFIEGGGRGEVSDEIFKNSWRDFFASAGLAGKMPKVVRGRSRTSTYRKFRNARPRANEILLLLVDSEGPVETGRSAWEHLRQRREDGWVRPNWADANSAYLMVQFMETWFLADPNALRRYFYRSSGNMTHTPAQEAMIIHNRKSGLESMDKATVMSRLDRLTGNRYEKGKVSFKLLSEVDPNRVADACPHAKALLDYLRGL